MRLSDLDPRWFKHFSEGPISGISFLCPCCRTQRIAVGFAPTFDDAALVRTGVPWPHPQVKGPIWTRSGETFETISLFPSLDASRHGHWHGFIEKGEVKP